MTIRFSRRAWMALGCVAALVVSSCGGGSTSAPTASLSPTTAASASAGASASVGSSPTSSNSAAHDQLPATIQQAGIRMASELDYPPYEFIAADGTQTGFEVEVAQAMAADLSVPLVITNVPFSDLIPGIQAGRYDISMSGMTDTAAREGTVDFVDYLQLAEGILVKAGNPKSIAIDNYCGITIVDPVGSLDLTRAQELAAKCTADKKAAIKIVVVPTTADDILALESGRADASLSSPPANAYSAQQSNGKLEAVPGIIAGTGGKYAGIGVLKGATQLAMALQTALNDVIANGQYAAILTKYGVASLAVAKATINIATNPSQ